MMAVSKEITLNARRILIYVRCNTRTVTDTELYTECCSCLAHSNTAWNNLGRERPWYGSASYLGHSVGRYIKFYATIHIVKMYRDTTYYNV